MKPYFEDDSVTLYCGNQEGVLPALADSSFDLAVADPMYNVGYRYDGVSDSLDFEDYLSQQLQLAQECCRLLKDGSSLFYLNYPEFAARMFCAVPEVSDLKPYELIAWIYNQHTGGKPLRKAFRLWCWLTKGGGIPYADERQLEGEFKNPEDPRVAKLIAEGKSPRDYDWWRYEQVKNVSAEKVNHPCQLPAAMVSRIVRLACPEGGTVLDPFAGSGTTARAAIKSGRRAVLIEQSEKYCAEIVESLSQRALTLTA